MASPMETPHNKRINQENNQHTSFFTTKAANQRPNKVQRTLTPQPNQPGGSINIPEFMGPMPTILHHEESTYLPYSPFNLQNDKEHIQDQSKTKQDPQRSYNYSPRRQPEMNSTNTMPTSPGEDPFCMYREEHIKEGIKQCKNSLIGKLLSNKPMLKPIIQNTLMGIWGNPTGFTITETEGGLYHITMDLVQDIQRAVKGNPWLIRNSWFMVHTWDRKLNPSNIDFKHVPVWIQIWGLPIHCKTVIMGKHLGTQLGKVEESALYDYPQQARIVKIKVHLTVEEPIRPGMFIGNPKDGITWVDFINENIPMFCFTCGLIGHNEDKCDNIIQPVPEGSVNPRGPWLRSDVYGINLP
ncbi:hypothetical protein A2U01_0012830, partial [Trifolium medium]|nr:hypothetical protein [Trifolium medium]